MNRKYISGLIDAKGVFTEDRGNPVIRFKHKDPRIIQNLRNYFYQEEGEEPSGKDFYLFELRGETLINNIDDLSIILGKNKNFKNWVDKYPKLRGNIIPV